MKKKVFRNVWLRVAMIVAVVTTAFAGTAWAEIHPIDIWIDSFTATSGSIDGDISFSTTNGSYSADGELSATKITLTANNGAKINSVTFRYTGSWLDVAWTATNANGSGYFIGQVDSDYENPVVSGLSCDEISFNGRYNQDAKLYVDYISVQYTPGAPAHAITALSSDESKGTVELDGNVIIATPNHGYGVDDTNPYTITAGEATVTPYQNNEFDVVPTSDCTIVINFVAHAADSKVNFEHALNSYTDWEHGETIIRSKRYQGENAHGGKGYFGITNATSAWMKTVEKIEYPGTFTCYVRKTEYQESLTWKIQVSSDGSNWTDVETYTPAGGAATNWEEFSADLSLHTDVYVRLYYTGSGKNGAIDDIDLTETTATVPVSVADYGYSTFCCHRALDFTNSSITAYYVTTNGSKLTYNQITKVPANTGVLLHKAGGVTDEEVPALIGNPDGVPGNVLVPGSDETVITWTATDKKYILYNHPTKGVGFFGANNSPVPSNRAYLQLSGDYVKSYIIDLEDDATGIEDIDHSPLTIDHSIYNLAGQRMSKMQKGINIVNGKKILF